MASSVSVSVRVIIVIIVVIIIIIIVVVVIIVTTMVLAFPCHHVEQQQRFWHWTTPISEKYSSGSELLASNRVLSGVRQVLFTGSRISTWPGLGQAAMEGCLPQQMWMGSLSRGTQSPMWSFSHVSLEICTAEKESPSTFLSTRRQNIPVTYFINLLTITSSVNISSVFFLCESSSIILQQNNPPNLPFYILAQKKSVTNLMFIIQAKQISPIFFGAQMCCR